MSDVAKLFRMTMNLMGIIIIGGLAIVMVLFGGYTAWLLGTIIAYIPLTIIGSLFSIDNSTVINIAQGVGVFLVIGFVINYFE